MLTQIILFGNAAKRCRLRIFSHRKASAALKGISYPVRRKPKALPPCRPRQTKSPNPAAGFLRRYSVLKFCIHSQTSPCISINLLNSLKLALVQRVCVKNLKKKFECQNDNNKSSKKIERLKLKLKPSDFLFFSINAVYKLCRQRPCLLQ